MEQSQQSYNKVTYPEKYIVEFVKAVVYEVDKYIHTEK